MPRSEWNHVMHARCSSKASSLTIDYKSSETKMNTTIVHQLGQTWQYKLKADMIFHSKGFKALSIMQMRYHIIWDFRQFC